MRARWILFVLLAVPGELIARSGAAGPVPNHPSKFVSEHERSRASRRGDVRTLGRPELVSPSGIIEEAQPTFTWKAVDGAEEYFLEIRGKSRDSVFRNWFSSDAVCAQNGMCSVPATLSELTLADGRYYWWVRAANFTGTGPRSRALRLRIQTSAPTPKPPVPIAPRGLTSPSTIDFVWQKEETATEYFLLIMHGRQILFGEWLVADQALCPDETCSYLPPNLALDFDRYAFRLRSRNSGGTSRWGRTMRFRVVMDAPMPVEPIGAADPTPTFVWNAVPDATYYVLVVTRDGERISRAKVLASNVCNGPVCSAEIPNLVLADGTYAWAIRAGRDRVRGLWSEPVEITVGGTPTTPPGPTSPIAPTGTIGMSTPTYVWTAVPEATDYQLTVFDGASTLLLDVTYSLLEAQCAAECMVTPTATLNDGDYSFVVTTFNGAVAGPPSSAANFTVDAAPSAPIGMPALVSPNGTITVSSPSFVWNEVAGATDYTLEVFDAASSPQHQQTYTSVEALCSAQCTVTPPLDLPDGDYNFRVRGENAAGMGPFSDPPLAFTVSRSTSTSIRILTHNDGDTVSAASLLVSGNVDTDVVALTVQIGLNGQTVAGPRPVEISPNSLWSVFVLPSQLDIGVATLSFEATDSQGGTSSIALTLNVSAFDIKGAGLIERATFGATPDLLDELSVGGAGALEDRLLNPTPDPTFQAYVATLPTSTADDVRQYALAHALFNPNQLQEVMTQFWDNHFSTDMDSHDVPSWELEENVAFRENAFGRFRDLLGISAKSPAMLHYLNQTDSTRIEPNENYSREVLELHTLSVDGPYTQSDVEALARILTGWKEQGGQFVFDAADHDDQEKIFLGQIFPAGGGLDEGERVLDMLAEHPDTARFICHKLVELFVTEAPSSGLVSSCSTVFLDNHLNGNPNQMREVVSHVLDSADFLDPSNFRAKVKTPLEIATSTVRNLEANVADLNDLERELRNLGMNLFHNRPPDGFAEVGDEWIDTGLMLERVDFVNEIAREAPNRETWLDLRQYFSGRGVETTEGIVGFLFNIAFFGEFTDIELQIAMNILTANGSAPFDINASDAEDRLRRLAGTVLSFPGFQHQ